jgi:hypothetical protein
MQKIADKILNYKNFFKTEKNLCKFYKLFPIQSTLEIAALDLAVSIFDPKELEILILTLKIAVKKLGLFETVISRVDCMQK